MRLTRPLTRTLAWTLAWGLVLGLAFGGAVSPASAAPASADPPGTAHDRSEAHRLPEAHDRSASYALAKAYAASKAGDALLVWERGRLVVEDYTNGYDAATPHWLASGTKTFVGAMAWAAVDDGLLSLDERVAETIPAWADDPQKSTITIRQLLHLTSGLETGAGRAPSFEAALDATVTHPPGEAFRYGPVGFQVFGALLQRKLDGASPASYLARRLLEPIGAAAPTWSARSGDVNLGGGAKMTASDWLRFGRLLLQDGAFDGTQVVSPGLRTALATPTAASPGYGLTVWLNAAVDPDAPFFDGTPPRMQPDGPEGLLYANGPGDLFMAAGLHNQRLYVIPSREMVVVRFGRRDASWHDGEFLARLLDGVAYDAPDRQRPAGDDVDAVAWLTERQLATLDSVLTLTDAQVDALRPILRRRAEGMLDIRADREAMEPLSRREKRRLGRRLRSLARDTDDAIRAELTPEQQDAYRAYRDAQRDRFRNQR